eukprot:278335-Chlamydomonas_euryale.AAC.9
MTCPGWQCVCVSHSQEAHSIRRKLLTGKCLQHKTLRIEGYASGIHGEANGQFTHRVKMSGIPGISRLLRKGLDLLSNVPVIVNLTGMPTCIFALGGLGRRDAAR